MPPKVTAAQNPSFIRRSPRLNMPNNDTDPMAAFQAMIQSFTDALNAQQNSPALESRTETRLGDPETFDGDRSKLTGFLAELRIRFRGNKSRFPDDDSKISYALSFLKDTPLLALQPILGEPEEEWPEYLTNFDKFANYLTKQYGDPNEKATARRKLRSLVQTTSAADYFSEFCHWANILKRRDDESTIDQAIFGLKDVLKDELARHGKEFTTLDALRDFIIPLDDRLWVREVERRKRDKEKIGKSVPIVAPPPSYPLSVNGPTPGQSGSSVARSSPAVGQAQGSTANIVSNNPFRGQLGNQQFYPRGPLSNEEKERRRRNNACHYCGSGGHLIAACPQLARQNTQFNLPQAPTQVKVEMPEYPSKNGQSSTM